MALLQWPRGCPRRQRPAGGAGPPPEPRGSPGRAQPPAEDCGRQAGGPPGGGAGRCARRWGPRQTPKIPGGAPTSAKSTWIRRSTASHVGRRTRMKPRAATPVRPNTVNSRSGKRRSSRGRCLRRSNSGAVPRAAAAPSSPSRAARYRAMRATSIRAGGAMPGRRYSSAASATPMSMPSSTTDPSTAATGMVWPPTGRALPEGGPLWPVPASCDIRTSCFARSACAPASAPRCPRGARCSCC